LYCRYVDLERSSETETWTAGPVYFLVATYACLLQCQSQRQPAAIRPAVQFGYITGWRIPSEVLRLQSRHVDFEARVVRLDPHTTKNDEGRTFPFTDALEQLLEAQKAEHDRLKANDVICPWVFKRSNRKVRGKRITTVVKSFRAACTTAGCPGRIPHDLRRTAVRNLVRAGVPERVAMQMTGHKTRSVFERYNIVSVRPPRGRQEAQRHSACKTRGV
jgi:integrase